MSGARFVGFQPDGVAALSRSTREILDDLARISSADPSAVDVMTTIREIGHLLSTRWMPVLAALVGDRSMTEWSGSDTAVYGGHGMSGGSAPTPPVDAMLAAAAVILDVDQAPYDALVTLQELLTDTQTDEQARHDFLAALGVGGFVDLVMMLGTVEPAEDALATAVALRDGLGAVGPADGFAAAALAAVMVDRLDGIEVPTGTDPYSMVDFVMESDEMPAGTAVALTEAMVARELTAADDDSELYPTPWLVGSTGSNLSALTSGPVWAIDPMAAVLAGVAASPGDARALFSDTAVAEYLVRDRAYGDGYTAMMAFVEAATAGPDVIDVDHPPSEPVLHDVAVFATQAVNWLGQRDPFDPADVSDAASVSAADIEVAHILAAEVAIVRSPRRAEPDAAYLADPGLAVVRDESLGAAPGVEVAVFGMAGLDRLTVMASESDEGILLLRAGVNGFQDRRAAGTAALVQAAGSPTDGQLILDQALTESGHVEGYFVGTIGRHLEGRAAAEDARVSFWIGAAGTAAGLGLRAAPPLAVFASGIPGVQHELRDTLAASREQVVTTMEGQARDAGDALLYRYTSALVEAGLVDVPSSWPDGEPMPSWNEFQQLGPNEIDMFWNGASDPGPGRLAVDLHTAHDAVVLEQLDAYVRLG